MKISLVSAILAAALLSGTPALALESYPTGVTEQFNSWCTGSQGQPQTVCSCAMTKAALEIPAAAMASFLSASAGSGMVATAQGVGTTTLQIIAACAAAGGNTGTTGGGLMKSLGGTLGQ